MQVNGMLPRDRVGVSDGLAECQMEINCRNGWGGERKRMLSFYCKCQRDKAERKVKNRLRESQSTLGRSCQSTHSFRSLVTGSEIILLWKWSYKAMWLLKEQEHIAKMSVPLHMCTRTNTHTHPFKHTDMVLSFLLLEVELRLGQKGWCS